MRKSELTREKQRLLWEEISVFYVAVTRAKKNVFLTVNTGLNQWGYVKQKSCLVELQGLTLVDYTWEDIIL